MNIPANARAWIEAHLNELRGIQTLGETHPVNAALALSELTEGLVDQHLVV